METWRKVWRDGMAPCLPTAGLAALREALASDDPRLIQGTTTDPPPLACVEDWPVERGCLVSYCCVAARGGFKSKEVGPPACSVAQAEEAFAQACYDCDQRLNEPAACRWLLNWFDETPRAEMRRLLLEEVDRVLEARAKKGQLPVQEV